MALIRPQAANALWRGREVLMTGAVAGFGLWLMALGGYVLLPVGAITLGIGATLTTLALRKLRFAQTVTAPGIVELDEAQVGYLAPEQGGFLSLDELVEIRLLVLHGRRMWRLKQADGQALLIPVDAAGADKLFDAFASLKGMDTAALVTALNAGQGAGMANGQIAETRVIWRKPSEARLQRA